jgi:hypothetical protein
MFAAAITAVAGCLEGADRQDEQYDVSMAESELAFTGWWVYDAGTQCTVAGVTMHCCPTGYAMIGANVGGNVFKCAQLTGFSSTRFFDGGTQRNNMHSCPYGSVMVGLHADWNYFACQTPYVPVVSEYVDGGTQDGNMHVCAGGGYAMSGIRIDQNKFNCSR